MRIAFRAVPLVCTLLALDACSKAHNPAPDGSSTVADVALPPEQEAPPPMQAPRPEIPASPEGYTQPGDSGLCSACTKAARRAGDMP